MSDVRLRWLLEKAFELERMAAGLRVIASQIEAEMDLYKEAVE